jgi:hypothetical protein
MAFKMKKGNIYRGLILRNEKANENYDTDFLYRQETDQSTYLTIICSILKTKQNLIKIQEICCFLRKFTVTINT